MSDLELIDAVAHVTGEDAHEIRRRGFVLTGPEDSGSNPEPECLLDVMLVDLPESGTVDWDALGFGCREPFFTSTLQPQRHFGGSPFQKQIAMSTPFRTSTLTRKPVMFRSGGKNRTATGSRIRYASNTSQPSHVHGGPQPQP